MELQADDRRHIYCYRSKYDGDVCESRFIPYLEEGPRQVTEGV